MPGDEMKEVRRGFCGDGFKKRELKQWAFSTHTLTRKAQKEDPEPRACPPKSDDLVRGRRRNLTTHLRDFC
jgi:hypothetical protein